MPNEIVIACYRPHEGKDEALRGILAGHVSVLREQGLATDRPVLLLRAGDGTYLEIFEWFEGKSGPAHENPAVMKVWNAMGEVADFVALGDLAESVKPFPHFTPVDGVTS